MRINRSAPACTLPEAFLAPMRTRLVFDTAAPGLPSGIQPSATDAATGAVTLTQTAAAFMRKPPGAAVARVQAGGLTLAGGLQLTVRP